MKRFMFSLVALLGAIAIFNPAVAEVPVDVESQVCSTMPSTTSDVSIVVTATVYHPVVEQTDVDPLITASGRTVDLDKLCAGELRWVALSRDLLSRWGGRFRYGDRIWIEGSGDCDIDGEWVVQDAMNGRFCSRIDLLVDPLVRSAGRWDDVRLVLLG